MINSYWLYTVAPITNVDFTTPWLFQEFKIFPKKSTFTKENIAGYDCNEIDPGFFVPQVDHWGYEPENSGTIDGVSFDC